MRKILIGFAVVVVIAIPVYFRFHRPKPPVEVAYAGNREVTLWSTTAQVRSVVTTVHFGDVLDVINRYNDEVEVRTAAGVIGWASARDLLSGEFWQKAKDLEATTSGLPVEARGHTRVLSNLHLEPGREAPRIRQVNKDVPLELFERRVESIFSSTSKVSLQETAASEATDAKKEDWWLVRARSADQSSVAGWMLGRFIDLDVPSPLPDYASSAGMRIVAWFELNQVTDSTGAAKPQYLVVGDRGSDGQPCDFTLMRVFTWGNQRERYETAFVESGVCGKLPVKITFGSTSGGDASFAFEDVSSGMNENRVYKMHQTIVRRVREGYIPPVSRKKRR